MVTSQYREEGSAVSEDCLGKPLCSHSALAQGSPGQPSHTLLPPRRTSALWVSISLAETGGFTKAAAPALCCAVLDHLRVCSANRIKPHYQNLK